MDHDVSITRLPSDFADVQPITYDAEYISDISNKMQIPERISAQPAMGPVGDNVPHVQSMTVPDRIIVSGQDSHLGMRSSLRQFDFESKPAPHMTYVNLMTPPRVLTVQEQHFPVVEDSTENTQKLNVFEQPPINGTTVPYVPSLNTSLLLNDENEVTVLNAQVSKLARRLSVVEQENERRAQRDLFLYPVVIGYVLLKVLSWFFRSPR